MTFGSRTYNFLKWTVMIALPAASALIAALGPIWGWQAHSDEIVGTIAAVTAFLGALIGISTQQYNANLPEKDGVLHVVDNNLVVELERPVDETADKREVTFLVRRSSDPAKV